VFVKERAAGITAVVVFQAIGSALLLIFGLGLLFLCAFIAGSIHLAYAFFFLTHLGLYPAPLHPSPGSW